MFNKENFRKKFLLPVTYCAVLGLAVWSGNTLIPNNGTGGFAVSGIEPAAGDEETMPKVNEADLKDAPVVAALTEDAKEQEPLRISPDKPEVIQLNEDAINILVGSEETLRAVPDTNRTIVLIPKKPGATFIKVTNADGKIIMQRHVIVGAPERANKYLRIRRACANDDKSCKEFSVYYCPDMCHEVSVVQGENGQEVKAPANAPSAAEPENDPASENIQAE
jgi:hypothetical protein